MASKEEQLEATKKRLAELGLDMPRRRKPDPVKTAQEVEATRQRLNNLEKEPDTPLVNWDDLHTQRQASLQSDITVGSPIVHQRLEDYPQLQIKKKIAESQREKAARFQRDLSLSMDVLQAREIEFTRRERRLVRSRQNGGEKRKSPPKKAPTIFSKSRHAPPSTEFPGPEIPRDVRELVMSRRRLREMQDREGGGGPTDQPSSLSKSMNTTHNLNTSTMIMSPLQQQQDRLDESSQQYYESMLATRFSPRRVNSHSQSEMDPLVHKVWFRGNEREKELLQQQHQQLSPTRATVSVVNGREVQIDERIVRTFEEASPHRHNNNNPANTNRDGSTSASGSKMGGGGGSSGSTPVAQSINHQHRHNNTSSSSMTPDPSGSSPNRFSQARSAKNNSRVSNNPSQATYSSLIRQGLTPEPTIHRGDGYINPTELAQRKKDVALDIGIQHRNPSAKVAQLTLRAQEEMPETTIQKIRQSAARSIKGKGDFAPEPSRVSEMLHAVFVKSGDVRTYVQKIALESKSGLIRPDERRSVKARLGGTSARIL